MEAPDSNSNTHGQDNCRFQATLSYIMSSCLKKTNAERFLSTTVPSWRGRQSTTCILTLRLLLPDLLPIASGHRWAGHTTGVSDLHSQCRNQCSSSSFPLFLQLLRTLFIKYPSQAPLAAILPQKERLHIWSQPLCMVDLALIIHTGEE